MEETQPTNNLELRDLFCANGGRDELNLAEFPITLLSDRVPDGCKTLVFEDKVFDKQVGEMVSRKVTVTGSDAHGLPTAIDDEVLVALLQLTKLDGFRDPKVNFSRYEVLQVLGWKDVGKNYTRVEEALNRWIGVTLYYEKAWWDNEAKAWVDAKFHILDNVTMISPSDRKAMKRRNQLGLFSSWFKWNEVVFKSFQADNLKKLDLDTYFNLKSSVAKRLFRFLDKRFYHSPRWEFDLEEFAFQHIGLSRSYDSGQIKAKLQPGLEELETEGFLEPLSREERYSKASKGLWRIIVIKAKGVAKVQANASPRAPELIELETDLVARGITPVTAADLAQNLPPERVRLKLEVFDWLLSNKDKRVMKSPSGYLVSSIRNDYSAPKGFESRTAREERLKADTEKRRLAEELKRRKEAESTAREEADKEKIQTHWASLPPAEQEALRQEALAKAPSFLVGQFRRNEKTNPKQADFYWQVILSSVLAEKLGLESGEKAR
jgi:hypothetical protein